MLPRYREGWWRKYWNIFITAGQKITRIPGTAVKQPSKLSVRVHLTYPKGSKKSSPEQ